MISTGHIGWHGLNKQLGNKAHAKALFQQASYDRSYYGFMAAIQSGMPIRITEEILQPEYNWQEAVRLWPALLRIEELIALDETGMARNEWLFLLINPVTKINCS